MARIDVFVDVFVDERVTAKYEVMTLLPFM